MAGSRLAGEAGGSSRHRQLSLSTIIAIP